MRKKKIGLIFFDRKIHKQVRILKPSQLADAQSTGLGRRGCRRELPLDGALVFKSLLF